MNRYASFPGRLLRRGDTWLCALHTESLQGRPVRPHRRRSHQRRSACDRLTRGTAAPASCHNLRQQLGLQLRSACAQVGRCAPGGCARRPHGEARPHHRVDAREIGASIICSGSRELRGAQPRARPVDHEVLRSEAHDRRAVPRAQSSGHGGQSGDKAMPGVRQLVCTHGASQRSRRCATTCTRCIQGRE